MMTRELVWVIVVELISSSSNRKSSSDHGAAPVINIDHKRGRQALLGPKRERVTEVSLPAQHLQWSISSFCFAIIFIYSGNGFVKKAVICWLNVVSFFYSSPPVGGLAYHQLTLYIDAFSKAFGCRDIVE